MLIKSVVPHFGSIIPTCKQAEPTTRILGPGGMCVDVRYGLYLNGSTVQLWPCKYNYVNQLWTFRMDGTIRSNGKCLTSRGNTSGDTVVVDDCPRLPTDRVVWELQDDGTIVLKRSGGLVLSVDEPHLTQGASQRSRHGPVLDSHQRHYALRHHHSRVPRPLLAGGRRRGHGRNLWGQRGVGFLRRRLRAPSRDALPCRWRTRMPGS
uniref:Ricin B lectin domain-containing protein n=1 Tax=Arundo donax TaxID=35708 RepID=A0A0A9CBW2_ARUDO